MAGERHGMCESAFIVLCHILIFKASHNFLDTHIKVFQDNPFSECRDVQRSRTNVTRLKVALRNLKDAIIPGRCDVLLPAL
jgi:hypothetical protein